MNLNISFKHRGLDVLFTGKTNQHLHLKENVTVLGFL